MFADVVYFMVIAVRGDALIWFASLLFLYLLVEAAAKAQSKDPSWHRQYIRLSMNKHHGVAKVAIAHKLAVRLYWMLCSGQNYTQIMERGSQAGQSVLAGGCGCRPTN